MKQLLIMLLVLGLCGIAYAEQTGSSWFHSHSYTDNDSYVDRYSEYQEKQKMPLGIGVDVILYQPEGAIRKYTYIDSINVESKWDMANSRSEVYFVTHVNLWAAIKDWTK